MVKIGLHILDLISKLCNFSGESCSVFVVLYTATLAKMIKLITLGMTPLCLVAIFTRLS